MLQKVFKRLNLESYDKVRKEGGVGCPFHKAHGGPIDPYKEYKDGSTPAQRYCMKLCGVLYPKAVDDSPYNLKGVVCPCSSYESESYIKRKFWNAFHKARR